ncbi:helix-turn-helix domain-containing protein [Paenibacillus sp. N3/727]|uniref:helix-turn-helix domain-containing protein n=1 Tax=Paenibacillus sp. N3/727 TaxID=2925845 RepID=UPI001F5385E5|nr:helix-turn-helix domain-containing protein [Paenibacillus sp. N3/727]UNK20752.1 helix-turn-helix domain-containing protein [Paenibacillus sp. N3/727]
MGHLLCFQVILSNGERLWPASIFPARDEIMPFQDLQMVRKILERDGKVIISVISYDVQGERLQGHRQVFAKDELSMIQGPIPSFPPYGISVNEVFGLSEAARLWGIEGGGATIRKALERGEFSPSEIRKSDGILLVTFSGMQRRYNAVMKNQWMEIHTYFVQEGAILEEPENLQRSHNNTLSTIARRHRKASEI